jgi:hypothetical protein
MLLGQRRWTSGVARFPSPACPAGWVWVRHRAHSLVHGAAPTPKPQAGSGPARRRAARGWPGRDEPARAGRAPARGRPGLVARLAAGRAGPDRADETTVPFMSYLNWVSVMAVSPGPRPLAARGAGEQTEWSGLSPGLLVRTRPFGQPARRPRPPSLRAARAWLGRARFTLVLVPSGTGGPPRSRRSRPRPPGRPGAASRRPCAGTGARSAPR